MWVDAPQVGNLSDQKWGISVIAVTRPSRSGGGSSSCAAPAAAGRGSSLTGSP